MLFWKRLLWRSLIFPLSIWTEDNTEQSRCPVLNTNKNNRWKYPTSAQTFKPHYPSCYLQMHFIGLQYHRNALAAGAVPQTPLGSLQCSSRPPSCWGGAVSPLQESGSPGSAFRASALWASFRPCNVDFHCLGAWKIRWKSLKSAWIFGLKFTMNPVWATLATGQTTDMHPKLIKFHESMYNQKVLPCRRIQMIINLSSFCLYR